MPRLKGYCQRSKKLENIHILQISMYSTRIGLGRPNLKLQQSLVKKHPGIHNKQKASGLITQKICIASPTDRSRANSETGQGAVKTINPRPRRLKRVKKRPAPAFEELLG
jgi:hypothetical protein